MLKQLSHLIIEFTAKKKKKACKKPFPESPFSLS